MVSRELFVLTLILVAVRGSTDRQFRGHLPVPDVALKVVTSVIGQKNEQLDDPTKQWFSGVTANEMITGLRIQYIERNDTQLLRCVGFTYGDQKNNCPPSCINSVVVDFVMERDEYINYVSGDSYKSILSIYFRTNKRDIGPFGFGVDPVKHEFKYSNGGAPLLYVEGLKGEWIYSLYFSFYYTTVLDLESKANEFARETYSAITTEIDDLYKIQQNYRRMYPDLARKGCYQWDLVQTMGAQIACDFQHLLNQATILTTASKDLQQHQPRNLLTLKDFDSAKYLDEVKGSKDFHNLMTEIKFDLNTVISVTEQQSADLRHYFKQTAEFDESIAQQDRIFIKGKIKQKRTGSVECTDEVSQRLTQVLGVGISVAAANVIDQAYQLASVIGSNMNPFKWIFGGPDVDAIFAAVEELMSAVKDLVILSTLMGHLNEFVKNARDIAARYAKNQDAIDAMEKLVGVLANETDAEVIAKNASAFVQSYGNYSPAVSNEDIAYTTSLLNAVASESCSVLARVKGMVADVVVTMYNAATLDCVYLPAAMAKLGSYFADVYTLQFEMIDALTSIVKGAISVAMADRIGSIQTTIDIRTATMGTAIVETNYQAASLARCDILEYLAAGNRPELCERLLFQDSGIQKLISYTGSSATSDRTAFAYIPTTPQEDIGIPFVNISKLVRGEYQSLKLPMGNKVWMKQYGWLPSTFDPEVGFYVKGIEIYLPGLMCNETNEPIHTVKIDFVTDNPTYLYSEEAPPRYSIDKQAPTFEYSEPAEYCAGEVIYFPVKDNQTGQVQVEVGICYLSPGLINPDPKDDFTYPSLGTTFTYRVTGSIDCTLVENPVAFNFHPLITVRLMTMEIKVRKDPSDPGIDECWPQGSRCPTDEHCQDRELDYCCQDSKGDCN